MTQAPVRTAPLPTVEPGRRMHPGEICPQQRKDVPERVRRILNP